MSKPKVSCFHYKRYNDIYVSNVSFSTDTLLAILDILPSQNVFVLIESDASCTQALLSIGKGTGIIRAVPHFDAARFFAICDKTGLHYLLSKANINEFDGMFMAGINNDIILDELICSFDQAANSMVKDGISNISISISFPENEMVISLPNEKYEAMSIKDKIHSIFRG